MKQIYFIITLIFVSNLIYSQQIRNSIFTNGDKLHINLGSNSEFYYTHTVEKGHTIYSLSKAYNVDAAKLYRYNNLQDGSPISLGQTLRIPLADRQLYKGVNLNDINKGQYIPVYYRTQPKDNIFRISRVYFSQPIDDLVKRNNLPDKNLALGQDLLIGWLPVNGKTQQTKEVESEFAEELLEETKKTTFNIDIETAVKVIDDLIEISEQELNIDTVELLPPPNFNPTLLGSHSYNKKMKTIKKTDVAFWDKTIPDNGAVFGLHGTAVLDSYINVFNPNSRRAVRVKVIGRIPYGTYTNDIKLVLSPRAAIQLGGLDRRFKVEIEYIVEK